MGEVWGALHPSSGAGVAIKVLSAKGAQDEVTRALFRNEVRAVARLDHRHIVQVYDHGVVSHAADAMSWGALVADSPWLAMELCEGGTLSRQCGGLDWQRCQSVLLALLDGLAHAHARGVIHRDLKPSNVLFSDQSTPLLSDFGLAHAIFEKGANIRRGTPSYISPEQLWGNWRDHGPWTDLYSFGCLAFAVFSGAPPFGRRLTPKQAVEAHLNREPPPLPNRARLAHGLNDWLAALLVKRPHRRLGRASDAAWWLAQLSPSQESGSRGDGAGGRTWDSLLGSERTESGYPRAPVQVDWRSLIEPRPAEAPAGVGLGLHGLRTIPMVGREAERDVLWSELARVGEEGRARAVVLRGPSGAGKSRLAQWLAQVAHSSGMGQTIRGQHHPVPGPGDGLSSAFERHCRVMELPASEMAERLAESFDGDVDVDALASAIRPDAESDAFSRPAQRHAVLARALSRLAGERIMVLWLEDVQWGDDALSFAHAILGTPLQTLLVMTVGEEELAERPQTGALLTEIEASTFGTGLTLEPLPAQDQIALARTLGLAEATAARIVERTAGNPLFAVQLVGDWIHRGLLQATEAGFELPTEAEVQLPESLARVWLSRVDRVLSQRSEDEMRALELAAALGHEVDTEEWRVVCELAGISASMPMIEELIGRRLVRSLDPARQWAFAHPMLQEAVAQRAAAAGRDLAHHRVCADWLAQQATPPWERLARHYLLSDQLERALAPQLRAVRRRRRAGELAMAETMLAELENAVRTLRLPATDAVRGRILMQQSEISWVRGDRSQAAAYALRAEEGGGRNGWTAVTAHARRQLGRNARAHGNLPEARRLLREAERGFEELGDRRRLSMTRRSLGMARMMAGDHDGAFEKLEEALEDARAIGEAFHEGYCHEGLAHLANQRGELDRAAEQLEAARECFERCGCRIGVADTFNHMGDVARFQGDLEQAERLYRDASSRWRALGSENAPIADANCALVLIERDRFGEAREILEPALLAVGRGGRRGLLGVLHVALLPCLARAGEWAGYDRNLVRAGQLLKATGLVDVDVARAAERGGTLALEAGRPDAARAGLELARAQWTALHRPGEADRVTQILTLLASL